MRSMLLAIMIWALPIIASATFWNNTLPVQNCEGEVLIGCSVPLGSYHSGSANLAPAFGLELRRNFSGSPFDAGIQLQLSGARRHGFNHGKYCSDQTNRTLGIAFTGDFNCRQGHKVNPFVGCALGLGLNDVVGSRRYPSKHTSLLISPRLGVEFFHFLRVSAQFNVSRKGYHNFALNIGLVVGGRVKKTGK